MKNLYLYLCKAKGILDDLGIPYGHIKLGDNLENVNYWGICKQIGRNTYEIRLHKCLMDDNTSEQAIMNTVIHELLHAYKGRMCHTGDWKKCANIVNVHYPQYNISRTAGYAEKGFTRQDLTNRQIEQVRYKITCESCGCENKYRRRSAIVKLIEQKPIGSCRCSKCGGDKFRLEVLK